MNIYSIHDTAAQYFLPPLFAKTDNQAKRMFIGSLGDSFPYRKDFSLYLIGKFDDDTGRLTSQDPAQIIAGHSIPSDMDPNYHAPPMEVRNSPQTESKSS